MVGRSRAGGELVWETGAVRRTRFVREYDGLDAHVRWRLAAGSGGSFLPTRQHVFALLAILAAGVFALDLLFPLGVAAGVPYITAVLVSLWLPSTSERLAVAGFVSLLTIVGFFLPYPTGDAFWIGLENRVIALFAIWIAAYLGDLVLSRRDELAAREVQLRSVLEAAADAILTIDGAGRVESCNEAAERLLGWAADELEGRSFADVLIPQESDSPLDGATSDVSSVVRELELRRRNGETLLVELSVSAVPLGEGRLRTAILRDVTERRRSDAAMHRAERLSAIGEAMARVAHESRNALHRMQLGLQILERLVPDDDRALRIVDDLGTARDELLRLQEDVRGYAAPVVLDRRPHALHRLVEEAWNDVEIDRHGRDVELDLRRCDEDVLPVDRLALVRVFRNLFQNALAACDDPVRIRVVIEEIGGAEGPTGLRTIVSDNGPGFPPDAIGRVFEPFFTTKTTGTGLGLAICRRVVESHGGTLEPLVERAAGAVFEIVLLREE